MNPSSETGMAHFPKPPEKTEPVLTINKRGLAKKVEGKPRAFILFELIQNAWDEQVNGARSVNVTATMLSGRPACYVCVEDDAPEGFRDLRSIYEMFRDSYKADNPNQRGRFEIGEKMVLALMVEGSITTTTGTVYIRNDKRWSSKKRTKRGSIFEGVFRMTRAEYDEMCIAVRRILPPADFLTQFNGEVIPYRKPIHSFETTLQTIHTDDEGNLKPTARKTVVNVYEPLGYSDTPHIFEMGLPVVELDGGDPWHVDVQQKVPVNWERDRVPPKYLQAIRANVLNGLHEDIHGEEQATETWVREGASHDEIEKDALVTIKNERFGEDAVAYDPSDPEGSKIAVSQGRQLVYGGALSGDEWKQLRKFNDVLLPAGQVTPSPKPYSPEGRPERVVDEKDWTPDMKRVARFCQKLWVLLTEQSCFVYIVREPTAGWGANASKGRLCLNLGTNGHSWFAEPNNSTRILKLIVHEAVHHTVHDHLSNKFHETQGKYWAKVFEKQRDTPRFFR